MDINDNAPKCEQTIYDVSVNAFEELGELVRVKAIDVDLGRNSLVKYELASFASDEIKSTFSIDTNTGALSFQTKINLQQQQQRDNWSVPVRAYDQSWPLTTVKSTVCQVNVKLIYRENYSIIPKVSNRFYTVLSAFLAPYRCRYHYHYVTSSLLKR